MKGGDGLLGIAHVFDVGPGIFGRVIALPADEVLEAGTRPARIKDGVYFILLTLVGNSDGRWAGGRTARDSVGGCGVEARDVEHRVDMHGWEELEFVCGEANFGQH